MRNKKKMKEKETKKWKKKTIWYKINDPIIKYNRGKKLENKTKWKMGNKNSKS